LLNRHSNQHWWTSPSLPTLATAALELVSLHTGNLEKLAHKSLHKGIESNKSITGIQGLNFDSSGQQHATALPTSNFNLAASNFFKNPSLKPTNLGPPLTSRSLLACNKFTEWLS